MDTLRRHIRSLRTVLRTAALVTALAFAIGAAGAPTWAIGPDELLDDPALEARARAIGKQLRCVVCQNQSIDDSNADIARDMRLLVRERLVAGDSDEEAIGYLVARYGDYVLLDPPFNMLTLPLWLGPPALVVLVLAIVVVRTRNALASGGAVDGGTEDGGADAPAADRQPTDRPSTNGSPADRSPADQNPPPAS